MIKKNYIRFNLGKTDLDRSFQKDGLFLDDWARTKWLGTVNDAKRAIRIGQTKANKARARRGLPPILLKVQKKVTY